MKFFFSIFIPVFFSFFSADLLGAQGRILTFKGNLFYISLGTAHGLKNGDTVYLLAGPEYKRGIKKQLATFRVTKAYRFKSIALLKRVTNPGYLKKNNTAVRQGVILWLKSLAGRKSKKFIPKTTLILGGTYSLFAGTRLNQYMPEYDPNEEQNGDTIDKFNSPHETEGAYRYSFLMDSYPLSHFTEKFWAKTLGFSFIYHSLLTSYTATPHENPNLESSPLAEPISSSWMKIDLNFRFPHFISRRIYLGSILKFALMDSHSFAVEESDEIKSDLRSYLFNFYSITFEQNLIYRNGLCFKWGIKFPLTGALQVEPDAIQIDKESIEFNYEETSTLSWWIQVSTLYKKRLQSTLEYRSESFSAKNDQFTSELDYSHISLLFGYVL